MGCNALSPAPLKIPFALFAILVVLRLNVRRELRTRDMGDCVATVRKAMAFTVVTLAHWMTLELWA